MAGNKMEETFGGYVVHTVPFPDKLDKAALKALKKMSPLLIEQPYSITYLHSYAQDSPFFAGLASGHYLVSRDAETGYTYATPVSYTHLRAHETVLDLVCRLLLAKKKNTTSPLLPPPIPTLTSTALSLLYPF